MYSNDVASFASRNLHIRLVSGHRGEVSHIKLYVHLEQF